jgi:hypothetical protein
MRSDPQFPGLEPGESHWIKGWVWFYEGEDVDAELKRLPRTHSLPMPGEVSPEGGNDVKATAHWWVRCRSSALVIGMILCSV